MSRFQDAIQRGTRASQPAAATVITGSLYYVTDELVTERSNGAAWQSYSSSVSATPQFTRLGLGVAADTTAVLKAAGQYFSPLVADGNSGAALTVDFDLGNEHRLTLTGNVTLTLSHPKDGGRYVILIATGAGGFTVTWPANVLWSGGTAPTITATASKTDLVTMIYVLTTDKYYAAVNQNY